MKFGDIISNGWAGDRNPLKLTMFLRYSGHLIESVSLDGRRVQLYRKDHRATVVIERDTPNLFQRWAEMAAEVLRTPDERTP
jgi:hypothetical protein